MPWIPGDPGINTAVALLEVTGLSVRFEGRNGTTRAVRPLSFSLDRGRVLGIVGESGSGKSVICLALLGLLPSPPALIDAGSALFDGIDLLHCGEQRLRSLRGREIGMVFQDPMTSLNPYLSVGVQLMEPLIYHRRVKAGEARIRAIDMLREVGIQRPEQCFRSYPHELSGGMRQRVMIGMALIAEPRLLICDEPTTALDVTVQAQILALVRDIQQKRNLAVIFISHDLAVVAGIADNLLVLRGGELMESGPAATVLRQPRAQYTRQLLAAIPSGAKAGNVGAITGDSDDQSGKQIGTDLLAVDNLGVRFRDHGSESAFSREKKYIQAVDGVSLQLRANDILGIVGESGSGKSTLGRAILGLTPITAGRVLLDGQCLSDLPPRQLKPWRRHMQMIFQDPYSSLNPRLTVYQTLAEPLLLHRIASRQSVTGRVLQLMDEVGLARSAIRKYPHEFSGGQRQRIAIGRALATRPRLVIADEPVSALDVTIQARILDLLLDLVKEHRLSMLFISHDLAVVRAVADRVAVMHRGKLIEQARTETLWHHPVQDYTRALLAAIPSF